MSLRAELILFAAACGATPSNRVTVPVVAATASSTPVEAPSKPLVLDETFAFGCPGWSPATRVALCFVGSMSPGEQEVAAKFVALDDRADAPEDVSITVTNEKIPAGTLGKLREATRGYVAWNDVDGFTGMDGSASQVFARSAQTYAGGENAAPRFKVGLFVKLAAKEEAIDEIEGAISGFDVAVYHAGRALLVERSYSIADEGQYEHHADVFVIP